MSADQDLMRQMGELLARLDQRVARLETLSPAARATNHPSAERVGVGDAVSYAAGDFEGGKICDLEPGGKPCDQCSMCNSRGF